jgi:hypothetical protein
MGALPFEPYIHGSTGQISLATGGGQDVEIGACPSMAGSLYWLLGSASGTEPGITSNGFTLPLNWDAYMAITIDYPNTTLLQSTLGALDANGMAQARIELPPGLDPAFAGIVLNHASVVFDIPGTGDVRWISEPLELELVP